ATVVTLTSLVEGMGIVLIEAMAVGAPIISVDCPSGPSEVLDGGRFGVLVPSNDHQQFGHELMKVIIDSKYREKLSSMSAEGVARFDIKRSIGLWEELLLRIGRRS